MIDEYLALDAERVAAEATAEAAPHVTRRGDASVPVCLVVSDNLKGGWTNRYTSEFGHRIEGAAITRRGWLVGLLWTSEPPSAAPCARRC